MMEKELATNNNGRKNETKVFIVLKCVLTNGNVDSRIKTMGGHIVRMFGINIITELDGLY